jgi:hypothetical protein
MLYDVSNIFMKTTLSCRYIIFHALSWLFNDKTIKPFKGLLTIHKLWQSSIVNYNFYDSKHTNFEYTICTEYRLENKTDTLQVDSKLCKVYCSTEHINICIKF